LPAEALPECRTRVVASLEEVLRVEGPAVLLACDLLLGPQPEHTLQQVPAHVPVVVTDGGAPGFEGPAQRVFVDLADVSCPKRRRALLAAAGRHARTAHELHEVHAQLEDLNKVGMALMSERDPDRLLGLILTQARRLTDSDAGSLYLVESDPHGGERLHFLRSQNHTLPDLPSPDFTLPLDETSIAGYAARTGEAVVIDDVYRIPGHRPFSFNRSAFDEKYGYRAKSMLAVPMVDHRDRVVGVLQLINRKRSPDATIRTEDDASRWVDPYSPRDVEVVRSLAGQAAVSIENGQLYQDIENLFAGFIKAAVTAIDRRDPTTAGHSVRVTELTCDTARLIHEQTVGPFADVRFTDEEMKQLRYAGLLHDFGKVGVKEEVLVKARKLPPVMEARVEARFVLIRTTLRARFEEARARLLTDGGSEAETEAAVEALRARLGDDLGRIDGYLDAVRNANMPRVLAEDAAGVLAEMAKETFVHLDGDQTPVLTHEELHYLSIPRGNLDEEERRQIESHVIHSYDFLQNIPWTDDLSRIAEIVRGHHEKLDGSGYPDRVTGSELCLETRIMTVCDIFDALTASDRPYKKALPVDRALDILRMEAADGCLDPDIVELFCTSGVYRKVLERDWREF
ncbi:MAG: GAF domain-containing protein, partial [Gemmatimonadota bacterium]|nr:GAF domain-containing protein [Gemmatimonadota bacterium]